MTTSGASGTDALAAQPRALIVSIYGMYGRDTGGWFAVAVLIRLLAELGIDEPAVRSAISRLKQRGLLESQRHNGAVGYGLTARGREIIAEGDRRIFHRLPPDGSGDWLLAVFSVPEHERARRHALRSRLAWLGFGSVAPGVWIAPARLAGETRDVLEADGLTGYVSLFTAGYLAFGDASDMVGRWWDLDRLEHLYQAFIDAAQPVLGRWQRSQVSPHERAGRAFADYVRVLTAWRRLPFLDPGLPPAALPPDWNGSRAADLFDRLQGRLGPAAREHVLGLTREPAP